jgi:hypothetical protein
MRSTNVVVNDAADEKIYKKHNINKKSQRRAQQPPSLLYKNKTDEEIAIAILLSKEKHSFALWKRQKAKDRKRHNILRNQARDAYVIDLQECD